MRSRAWEARVCGACLAELRRWTDELEVFEELDRAAAHNLVYVFGLAGPPLAAFALQVRSLVGAGRLLPDPHDLLATPAAIEASTPPAGAPVPRTIGTLDLVTIGYDGLMAADFGVPSGWGEDEVMLPLLTSAHRAIFEVSESAGQVEEIADVPETMRTPQRILAVFDRANAPKPGISRGQTLAKLERWKVEPLGYAELVERAPAAMAAVDATARTICYGHVGDGNVHVNVLGPAPAWDPAGILNPGVLFPASTDS